MLGIIGIFVSWCIRIPRFGISAVFLYGICLSDEGCDCFFIRKVHDVCWGLFIFCVVVYYIS